MRSALIIDFVLGFSRAFFVERDNDSAISYIDRLVALKAAGSKIDAHMQVVADALLADTEIDFDHLIDRIDAEVDELLSRGAGGEPE